MEHLTSLKNPKVQAWRSLKDRKGRKETGCFLVEGRKMVEEALRSHFPVEAVLADEGRLAELTLSESIPVYALPEHVLAAVCDTKTPQGVAAVVRMAQRPAKGGRLIALDGVQDPGNVGTILRSMDAAGFTGLLTDEKTADPYAPKTLRASMGSVFRIPMVRSENLPQALDRLAALGYALIAGDLRGQPFYRRPAVGERLCILIGNEGAGLSPIVLEKATLRLKLPIIGGAESLNAAVAASVMMYDFLRERLLSHPSD